NVPTRIALIPVGYGHGFNRSLSNQGRVLIRGQRVSVIGTVNMNMMSVDISDVAGVQPGDEVVIIGRQGEHEISVSSFSNFSDQLNYEMLTRLPANLPRRIVDIAED
ncbi:MAG TPA: alanine racemase, partial [Bacteroidetes bacterium]|nr:alanine racemase [Bacteroidota bacterium]